MKILKEISLVLLVGLLMFPLSSIGQGEETPLIKTKKFRELELSRAIEQAKKLSKGVLLVRLTSNNRKIKALENLVRDYPDSKRHRKQLRKTKAKTLDLQKETVTAYSNYYNFSEVYFIMDTDVKKLIKGTKKGVIINKRLEKDSTIDLTGRDFFFSYIGNPSAGTNTRSLLITDHTNHLIPKPFPYSTVFATALDKITFRSDAGIIIDAVERQERNLVRFYAVARTLNKSKESSTEEPKKGLE